MKAHAVLAIGDLTFVLSGFNV